jgi:hypothetical protein
MRKLFTAKPGKMTGLFLLLGIVALQWSFTTAVTGENRAVNLLTDTSTTPVAGTAVATSNKLTPKRSNRTTTSSKPALAANLERETVSFGSPTGGPETEAGTPKINNKKTAVAGSAKATDVKANEAKGTAAKTTDKKITEAKVADTKAGDTKATDAKSTNTKSAPAEKKPVDGTGMNNARLVRMEGVGTNTVNTKRTGTADTKSADAKHSSTAGAKTVVTAAKTKTASSIGILSNKLVVYDSLHLKRAGLSKKVFTMALTGMSKLVSGRHIKDNLLAIVDFSQPSNKKRLYVIDLNNYQLLYHTFVAHGMKSGRAMAQSFSNKPSSEKSSLGFYVTGAAYKGTNGYSLRLTGVEKGINDHAMDRGIVIHGADYVCEGLIESQGFIGRSFGCPAVAQEVSQELIDLLKGGSCLFIYHPSPVYRSKSTFLN